MSSPGDVQYRPGSRSKPRGINVRAFIEKVERGSKPLPDFFKAEQAEQANVLLTRENSGVKPPVPDKKPSLKRNSRSSPALVIVSSCCRVPPAKPPAEEIIPQQDVAEAANDSNYNSTEVSSVSEVNCGSEDSGNSTCDLKYSGSISSNQSSSLDPAYQVLSEVDDGYSERTSSSYGTTGSAVNEGPQYSDPNVVVDTTIPEHSAHRTKTTGGGAHKSHHSAYKYHVPNKLTGTLPRDKKKAAFIGKSVAKGRTTLKKKISSNTVTAKSGEDNASNNATIKGSTFKSTSSFDELDGEYSDFEYDSEFSDSEWETDGEESCDPQTDNQAETRAATDSIRVPRVDNNNEESDDSDYDVCIPPDRGPATDSVKSKSRFYTSEYEGAQQLVNLMKEHSSKKDKRSKKKSKHIKEFKEKTSVQKLVKRSNIKLAAVKTFLSGKLRKSKPDTTSTVKRREITIERVDDIGKDTLHVSASSLSIIDDHHSSDSDLHSVSSHVSHKLSDSASNLTPRVWSTTRTPRQRTQSTGALLVPPPLPPRNTRSQIFPSGVDLGSLPAPPPPPRTTSRGHSLSMLDNSEDSSTPGPYVGSYTPKFAKTKPQAAPRSPRPAERDVTRQLSKLSLPSDPRLFESGSTVHKTHSVPTLTDLTPSPEDSTTSRPHIPVRKESSKSLVVTSSDDESVKRRNEIMNCAAKTNPERQNSEKTISPIGEELPSPNILRVKVAPTSSLTESDRGCNQYMIEDEPLYQVYRESIITSVKDKTISKTSTLMRGGQPSISLWSSTPDVINSGVLDHMSAEEVKLQEASFEVVSSEASYLRSIVMLNKVFVNAEQFGNEEIMPARDKKALFSNITAVLDVSTRLFKELEEHWKSNVILTAVCEIISKYAYAEFDVYIKYCSNQAFQDRTLKKLSQNPKFTEALSSLERCSECHGLTMSSFLLLPMQRITRLPLLLDAILRRQEVWSDQYNNAQKCYELVKKVVSRCNEGARKMEQTEQVLSIETKLLFNKQIKKIPLTSQSRQLVKKGELLYLPLDTGKSTINLISMKPKNLCLFLFNDVLLITKKKGDNFSVIDYASRVNVDTEEWGSGHHTDTRFTALAQKSPAKFMFMLVLLENHQKKNCEFLLCCHTETERMRWMEAFTPQVQEGCDDKIYESWDCPQAQVNHNYEAQQPDELSLETGDILNILRKTPDGWYEGERVSDGRTGWLPSSYTVELQNEHVRARHLKERYKLLQAAAKLMK